MTKEFWWWRSKDRNFTLEEVGDLLERVKVFNAGAIDQYLTNHVERVFNEWLAEKGVSIEVSDTSVD